MFLARKTRNSECVWDPQGKVYLLETSVIFRGFVPADLVCFRFAFYAFLHVNSQ